LMSKSSLVRAIIPGFPGTVKGETPSPPNALNLP
jgi:hypothetical protein